jgi:hypothetical protein
MPVKPSWHEPQAAALDLRPEARGGDKRYVMASLAQRERDRQQRLEAAPRWQQGEKHAHQRPATFMLIY